MKTHLIPPLYIRFRLFFLCRPLGFFSLLSLTSFRSYDLLSNPYTSFIHSIFISFIIKTYQQNTFNSFVNNPKDSTVSRRRRKRESNGSDDSEASGTTLINIKPLIILGLTTMTLDLWSLESWDRLAPFQRGSRLMLMQS